MIALADVRGLATDTAGLTRALDGAPVAVALFDRELRLVRANERFRELTGCPGGMESLLALHEIFPTTLVAVGPALTAARRGEPYPPLPVRFPRAGGRGTTAEVSIAWLPDALQRADTAEDGLLFVANEIDRLVAGETEVRLDVSREASREARREARRDARRDARREVSPSAPLPRELRHDLANVLNLVGNVAQLIALRADEPEAVRGYAARLARAVERGSELVGASRASVGAIGTFVNAAASATASATADGDRGATGRSPMSASSAMEASGRRVLVVEDDEASRELMTVVLESAGHSVLAVEGIAAAIAVLEGEGGRAGGARPVEVLVTDVGLGDGNGWELVAIVRGRWPRLRVGVVTGWDAASDPDVAADFVLRKPIQLGQLIACVAGVR